MPNARNAKPGEDVFGAALRNGQYSPDYAPSEPARRFFAEVVRSVPCVAEGSASTLRVLECGCGTGFWLGEVARLAGGREVVLCGFDLSPGMVEHARRRLAALVPAGRIKVASVLDADAYAFGDGAGEFDLVYAYDVVQQLPRAFHLEACTAMAAHLAPGGSLVIFDQEKLSIHGIRMAIKKLITRRLGVPLVPRYYCGTRYPVLRRLARDLGANGRRVEIRHGTSLPKRALVVR